ncbi:hypothetical protein V492_02297 [Pseudogymnoascus sp. VKM F-4246]|nr:hypothetical protein V492_02297 [Pseudogymnoascus sp. VKM F-4246]
MSLGLGRPSPGSCPPLSFPATALLVSAWPSSASALALSLHVASISLMRSTHQSITSTNLFNDLKFENYRGIQRPWINKAMDDLRKMFSRDGTITFFVRNEKADFGTSWTRYAHLLSRVTSTTTPKRMFMGRSTHHSVQGILDRFDGEDANGTIIQQFYPKNFHKGSDDNLPTPFSSFAQSMELDDSLAST